MQYQEGSLSPCLVAALITPRAQVRQIGWLCLVVPQEGVLCVPRDREGFLRSSQEHPKLPAPALWWIQALSWNQADLILTQGCLCCGSLPSSLQGASPLGQAWLLTDLELCCSSTFGVGKEGGPNPGGLIKERFPPEKKERFSGFMAVEEMTGIDHLVQRYKNISEKGKATKWN